MSSLPASQAHSSNGFDVLLGNPPWVSYTGRQQADISDRALALMLFRFPSITRWPASHPAMLVLAVQLLGEQGRAGLVLPKQVAELSAYGDARAVVTSTAALATPVVDAGEDSFPGVTQPVGLFTLAGRPRGDKGSAAPWVLAAQVKTSMESAGAASGQLSGVPNLAALLADRPRFEPKTFADPGVHTGNVSKKIILDSQPPSSEGFAPVREGRDIAAFFCGAPKKWLWTEPDLAEGEYCTIREPQRYRAVPILVRQTADRPIAAQHRDPTFFRNSLLACTGVPGVPDSVVVAFLNSALFALLHRAAAQDANQKAFPQVKVRHLHSLPAIPVESLDGQFEGTTLRDGIVAAVHDAETEAKSDAPPSRATLERIERMVLVAFGLSPDLAPLLMEAAK